jgi:hypothetical protein
MGIPVIYSPVYRDRELENVLFSPRFLCRHQHADGGALKNAEQKVATGEEGNSS